MDLLDLDEEPEWHKGREILKGCLEDTGYIKEPFESYPLYRGKDVRQHAILFYPSVLFHNLTTFPCQYLCCRLETVDLIMLLAFLKALLESLSIEMIIFMASK